MKIQIAALAALFLSHAFAADSIQSSTVVPDENLHRYMIERTFPPGALDGLNASVKEKVNANNASVGVAWTESYANESKTKTFCVYQGPSEAAIRKAAMLNGLPVDRITEVPVELGAGAPTPPTAADMHRFIVELDSPDAAGKVQDSASNARFGVHWVKSYSNEDQTKTYSIYEAPSQAAVRQAASANGILVAGVTEVPVTLLPK